MTLPDPEDVHKKISIFIPVQHGQGEIIKFTLFRCSCMYELELVRRTCMHHIRINTNFNILKVHIAQYTQQEKLQLELSLRSNEKGMLYLMRKEH